jgi:hypothetical protein
VYVCDCESRVQVRNEQKNEKLIKLSKQKKITEKTKP